MLARRTERFPSLGEMNRANRFAAVAVFQVLRQQRLKRFGVEVLKEPINEAAQDPLRETFGRGIDRCDPAKMDRFLLVVLDHFKFRMIHANPTSAQPGLAKDNKLLTGGDHFLHVMQVEPAADQGLAQRVRIRFL